MDTLKSRARKLCQADGHNPDELVEIQCGVSGTRFIERWTQYIESAQESNPEPDWAAAETRQNRIEALRAASRVVAGVSASGKLPEFKGDPIDADLATLYLAALFAAWLETGDGEGPHPLSQKREDIANVEARTEA